MIFTCDDCFYTFIEKEDCGQCPDCGTKNIRRATEKEELEYYRNRAEFAIEIKRYVYPVNPCVVSSSLTGAAKYAGFCV